MKLAVEINAEVNFTEDPEKVVKAILNIFPKASIKVGESEVVGFVSSLEGLEKLRMMIRSRRIRSTVRMLFSKNISANSITFYINKQAAYMGRLSFYEAGELMALGPIKVRIDAENVEELINWFTM